MKFIRNLLVGAALSAGICPAVLGAVAVTITPSTVSNTYTGTITLQITGLTPGGSVVVQKFLDANTNGIIDGRDLLVQQFNLTDGQPGQVIGGITNYNVAGDTDFAANGTITATMNFQNRDFVQNLVGNYLYKISGVSPPITNTFIVTNFPFAQKFTGNVVSNSSSTTLSNAIVLLFPPPRPGHNGLGQPLGGTVANNAGAYSIMVPAGTYTLVAFETNYVFNTKQAPVLALGSSQTINTNLSLTNATSSITGRIVDANTPSIGLPGVFMPVQSTNGLLMAAFTDTNGNFIAPVNPGQWGLGSDGSGLTVHGYVGWNNGTNVSNGANVTLAFQKANALFYGKVNDNSGNPMVAVDVYSDDNNSNLYSADAFTGSNGKYYVGVVGGLGLNDTWQVGIGGDNSGPTNYIFSQPQLDQNGATNISVGQALLVNFTAIYVTNTISGNVKDSNGNNISGLGVSANATLNGTNYQVYLDTDTNGNFSMEVTNGSWNVSVNCGGGNDSLSQLGSYACPNSVTINIAGNNVVTNFVIQTCNGISISPVSPLPVGEVGALYSQSILASDCSGTYNWSQSGGTLPNNLSFFSGGQFYTLSGTPTAGGTSVFTVSVNDGGSNSTNRQYSVSISNALQITTTTLPNGTNGLNYSQQLHGTAGVPFGSVPYSWSLFSGSLPANLNLATNGLLSGAATVNGTFNFTVQATDNAGGIATQPLSLTLITTNIPPLAITTAGGQFFVLWSASAGTNFTLQTATNLAGPWAAATNGVPQNAFSFSNTAPAVFFRLH